MQNHEKFLGLYNDLDDVLRKKYHNNDRTVSMFVKFVSDLNHTGTPAYIQMAKKLNMIRVIRNNLIHELDMNSDNLIEISDETISFLKELVTFLANPRLAKDLCTPLSNLYVLKFDDDVLIMDVVKKMRETGHSQIPIINHQKLLKGVFSPNALFEYIACNNDSDLTELKLVDLASYYPIDKHFSEQYCFIPEEMIEEDIDDLFAKAYNENKKIAMAFVTKNGKYNEPISGIIVIKDLLDNTIFTKYFIHIR